MTNDNDCPTIPLHEFEKEVRELVRVLIKSTGLMAWEYHDEINHCVAAISDAAFRHLCEE